MDSSTSEEEEDVFSCGRCRKEFNRMEDFMAHKKSKVCKKKADRETARPKSTRAAGRAKKSAPSRAEVSGVSTVRVVDSADDGMPANLFEDTFAPNEVSSLAIGDRALPSDDDPPKPTCHFCTRTFKTVKDVVSHYAVEHNIPEELVPLDALGTTVSHRGSPLWTNKWSPISQKAPAAKSPPETPSPKRRRVNKGILMEKLGLSGKSVSPKATGQEDGQNSLGCEVCGMSFLSRAGLRTHLRSKSHKSKVASAAKNSPKTDTRGEAPVDTTRVVVEDKGPPMSDNDDASEEVIRVDVDEDVQMESQEESKPAKRPRRNVCIFCREVFPSRQELLKHLAKVHNPSRKERRSRKAPAKLRLSSGKDERDTDDGMDAEDLSSGKKGKRSKDKKRDCPHCHKRLPAAAKSQAVHVRRCLNRQKYQCALCRHQSRERYDFNIHVDHHKVWWDMSNESECPDGLQIVEGSIAKEVNLDDVRRGNLFEEDLEDTTLSEADLAALGLMPRSKLDGGDRKGPASKEARGDRYRKGGEYDEGSVAGSGADDSSEEDGDSKEGVVGSKLKCHPCQKWFHRTKLPDHMLKSHNMKKVFQCRDVNCLEVFEEVDKFVRHIGEHSSQPMFQCGCTSCKRDNADATGADYAAAIKRLKMKNYYRKLLFKCKTCSARFPHKENLDRHLQTETHRHQCEVCGKVLVSRNQHRSHMSSHSQPDFYKYLCEQCGKGFQAPRELAKHAATHSDERPFVCPTCKKGFVLKMKLDRHINTVHSSVKPHVCTHEGCGKAFTRKDKLNDHLLTHKASPPYKCEYCTKGFYRKDNLRDHLIYHTRQYKYQCKKCSKGFMRPKVLQQHIANEHPGEEGFVASHQVSQVASQINLTNREHDYVKTGPTGPPPMQQQLQLQQTVFSKPSMTERQAFATMLSTMQQGGNDSGKPSSVLLNAHPSHPTTLNTFVQILPQGQPGASPVTMQSSLPIQNSAAAAAAANSHQYRLTQSKLEQVKRQIEAVTQQLIVQQFGGDFFQQAANSSSMQ